ncbi:MAG: mechanosensitive ion channel [Deltaproteobacteria bacterium]|nr:mechanosensitive ion channel [Deltaproteobacteria bacterium]
MGGTITNYSTMPTRRVDLSVGVGYNDDLKKIRQVLNDLINSLSPAGCAYVSASGAINPA